MNDPPDGDVRSLNADSLTLTAECNHVLYKPCIVININKPHLETEVTATPARILVPTSLQRPPDSLHCIAQSELKSRPVLIKRSY